MKFATTLGIAAVLLSACSNEKRVEKPPTIVNAEFNQNFLGTWAHKKIDNTFLTISNSSVVLYQKADREKCFKANVFKVVSLKALKNSQGQLLSNRRVSMEEVSSGDRLTRVFSLSKDKKSLKVSSNNDYRQLDNARIQDLSRCNAPNIQNLALSLQMNYLPTEVKVHRQAAKVGETEYRWSAYFDINHSNKLDNDDIILQVSSSSKKAGDTQETTKISELTAQLLIKRAYKQQDLLINNPDWKIQLTQEQNTLHLTLPMSYHPLVRRITTKTPMKISTEQLYPSPEREVIEGVQDGPWKWSSTVHKDIYPNVGYVIPANQNEMIDARDDQLGESQWVDIRLTELKVN